MSAGARREGSSAFLSARGGKSRGAGTPGALGRRNPIEVVVARIFGTGCARGRTGATGYDSRRDMSVLARLILPGRPPRRTRGSRTPCVGGAARRGLLRPRVFHQCAETPGGVADPVPDGRSQRWADRDASHGGRRRVVGAHRADVLHVHGQAHGEGDALPDAIGGPLTRWAPAKAGTSSSRTLSGRPKAGQVVPGARRHRSVFSDPRRGRAVHRCPTGRSPPPPARRRDCVGPDSPPGVRPRRGLRDAAFLPASTGEGRDIGGRRGAGRRGASSGARRRENPTEPKVGRPSSTDVGCACFPVVRRLYDADPPYGRERIRRPAAKPRPNHGHSARVFPYGRRQPRENPQESR